jgi:hypothetical protein
MRSLILAAACGLLTLVTGCQTPHSFATPDSSWKSRIGQLKHTNNQRALVGEIVVQQRGAQEFQLDFLKGGSFPILALRQDATVARAEGLLANGRWQGPPDKAPRPLRPWLALREFFADLPAATGHAESHTFVGDGQRFEFRFSR